MTGPLHFAAGLEQVAARYQTAVADAAAAVAAVLWHWVVGEVSAAVANQNPAEMQLMRCAAHVCAES